jgi:hypothetical protein
MFGQPVACKNCGAMMTPQADGRTYACNFCKTQLQVAIEGQQIAEGMRLDLSNVDVFLRQLAHTLSTGFAESSRIQGDGHTVHSIEVNLDPDVFLVHREGPRVVTRHKKMVRGIALRTETLAMDRWVKLLTEALARHANTNARAAWVLARLNGDGK